MYPPANFSTRTVRKTSIVDKSETRRPMSTGGIRKAVELDRFAGDSKKMRTGILDNFLAIALKNHEKMTEENEEHSDSSSDNCCPANNHEIPKSKGSAYSIRHNEKPAPGFDSLHSSNSNAFNFLVEQLNYAALFASLTRQMSLLPAIPAAPAAASQLPLLYPHLYQSLLEVEGDVQQQSELSALAMQRNQTQWLQGASNCPSSPQRPKKHPSHMCLTDPARLPSRSSQPGTPSSCKPPTTAKDRSPAVSLKSLPTEKDQCAVPTGGSRAAPRKKTPRGATRRIQFDEVTRSPVSGMYIKEKVDDDRAPNVTRSRDEDAGSNLIGRRQKRKLLDGADNVFGDSGATPDEDETAPYVEVSDEARRRMALIPNVIGDYVCMLCQRKYEDAFALAKHKCPRIGHKEYRCPECDKTFSCPANLASHRRWHKPKNGPETTQSLQSPPIKISKKMATSPRTWGLENGDLPVDLSNGRKCAEFGEALAGKVGPVKSSDRDEPPGAYFSPAPSSNDLDCVTCGATFDSHRTLRHHSLIHTAFGNFDTTSENFHIEIQCGESDCGLWFSGDEKLQQHKLYDHCTE